MPNTEKPTKKQEVIDAPKNKSDKTLLNKPDEKSSEQIKKSEEKEIKKVEDKKETKPEEKKKPVQKKPVVKKTEAVVNVKSIPISTKYSIAICRFIKNKKIQNAITDLEQVLMKKKAIPMKGEIPHRKGDIMSGRYPKKATEHFIRILKSLQANATANELENPRITEAVANLASRPYGRFGSVKRKRTHVKIVAKNKKSIKKKGGKNNGRKKNSSV